MASKNSYQESLNKKANAYKNAFATEFGQEVLADIQRLKNQAVFDTDALKMARRAALHDYAVEVEHLIALGKGEIKPVKRNVRTQEEPEYDPMQAILPVED